MTLTANQIVKLTDRAGRDIGRLAVERVDGDLLLGTFTPGADYSMVSEIFDGFAEAVDHGSLSVVDNFDKQIAALGIQVTLGELNVPAHDVQIYSDGAASCRMPFAYLNGVNASS